jgi:ribosomal-protein-alanine N-acetyltransferase
VSEIVIRDMRPEDVPVVSEVDRVCFVLAWGEHTFKGELTSPVCYYRVAELDGEVAGYIGSQMVMDEGHVTTFGVRPDLRRRGIGERLLADVLLHAIRSGCHRVTLEVRQSNESAIRLYRKYGFLPISRRPRYYTDNNEDAIVMWIEDTTKMAFQNLLGERLAALDVRRAAAPPPSKESRTEPPPQAYPA